MKDTIRTILLMGASAALAVVGMGSSCPGTGSSANFENPVLVTAIPRVETTQIWRTPGMFIDIGAVDASSNHLDNNQTTTVNNTSVASYPPIIFHDYSRSFYSVFNRGLTNPTTIGPTQVSAYVTQQVDFSSAGWVTGLSSFTQLDTSTSTDSQRPLVAVDSAGNAMVVVLARRTGTTLNSRPIASRHIYGNGAWETPKDISSVGETGDVTTSAAISFDASNNFVAAWVQNGKAYWNQFRPTLGWRFKSGVSHTRLDDVTSAVDNLGMSVGFDSYGNGYGVYSAAALTGTLGTDHRLMVARFRGNTVAGFGTTTGSADYVQVDSYSDAGFVGFPRIWVRPNGSASIFYYKAYGSSKAELHLVEALSANLTTDLGVFGASDRFDDQVGTGAGVLMRNAAGSVLEPALAYNGTQGAIAFIKNDGISERAYVFRSSGGAWTSLGAADTGGLGADVTWVDVSINSSSNIALVYSAISPVDNAEHVYGNLNVAGVWLGVTRLDSSSLHLAAAPAATAAAMPKVSFDNSGYAMAIFSVYDTLFSSPNRRRVVAVPYR